MPEHTLFLIDQWILNKNNTEMLGFRALSSLLFPKQILEITAFNMHQAKISDVNCPLWTVPVTSGLASRGHCPCPGSSPHSPGLCMLVPVPKTLMDAHALQCKSMPLRLAFINLSSASDVAAEPLLTVLLLYLLMTAAMCEPFLCAQHRRKRLGHLI